MNAFTDLWRRNPPACAALLIALVVALRIAVDASNGMAGTMLPKVFDGIKGLVIEKLHFDNSSGEFVHEPNPLVEANLAQVKAGVLKSKADFGVCFDGDADRCMVVDEQGRAVGCDLLLAVMLQEHPATVLQTLRTWSLKK